MVKKTGKEQLLQALKLMTDSHLTKAKNYVQMAIQEIEKVEKKKLKKEVQKETILAQWNDQLKSWTQKAVNPEKSLEEIEKLIKIEQEKLKPSTPTQQLLD